MNARRRFLLIVVVVPAILTGLLAMHFMAGANEVGPATVTMSIDPSASTSGVLSAPADCGTACITSSDMTMSMACVLALLATGIVLAVLSAFARRDPELLERLVTLWRARIASLPPSVPPSLHVLSITRI